jgi:hypothetical protein
VKTLAKIVTVALAALAPAGALAQSGGDVDIDSFRPAMDSRGYVTVNASQVLGNLDVSFGLVTDWGHSVLTLTDGPQTGANFNSGNKTYQVEDIISPTLQAALGLGGFLEVGVSLPFRIVSGTHDPDFLPSDPRMQDRFNFSAQGLGDFGVHAKIRFLNTSHSPLGVAIAGSVWIPAGHDEKSWLGENQTVERFSLILDHEWRRVRVAGNIGFQLRGDSRTFTDTTSPDATNQSVVAKNEVPFGAAIAFAVVKDRFDLVAELTGSVALDATQYQPLEALGAVKVYLARNSFFLLGGGAGLSPDKAANPAARAFIGIVFEPSRGD